MKFWNHIRRRLTGIRLKAQFNIAIAILAVVPVAILGWYIFRRMDENTVSTAVTYMQDTMEKQSTAVDNDIEALQMTTRYVLQENTIQEVLRDAVDGTPISTGQLLEIFEEDIRQAEQLLYSNPSLYSLRIYSVTDNVTEMMPILYRHERMLQQAWAAQPDPTGYYFDFTDNIFEGRDVQDSDHLIAYVTAMDDEEYGRLGYIEAAIGIPYLFPDIYTPGDGESAFLITPDGDVIAGEEGNDRIRQAAQEVARQQGQDESIVTKRVRVGHTRCIVSSLYIDAMDAHYVSVLDLTGRFAQQRQQRAFMILFFAAVVVILLIIVDTIVNRLLRDFYRILETVYTVQEGDISARVPSLGEGDTAVLGNEINTMLDEIDALMKDNLEKGLMEKNAQLRSLQNQINAHFLYNVLAAINMMAEIDGEYEICDAIVELGDMMRYSLRWTSGVVTVKDELDYVKNYVALMNIRLDGQVVLSIHVSDALMNNIIPKMTLQPLVENAITHGFEGIDGKARIEISAEIHKDKIWVCVTDRGRGMSAHDLRALLARMDREPSSDEKHGYALHNIRERIRLFCGDDCGLVIESQEEKGTEVTVILPHEEQAQKTPEQNGGGIT